MTDSYSILIIEDEKNILDFMARTLRSNGYKTITSETGQSGLSIINSQCPDLILLDLGLPDMDGNDIISSVRKWTSCPIIVISARAGEQDKVAALDLGADDYITKPFGTSELLARIRTSLRHSNRMASNSPLFIRPYKCQGLMLDFEKRMVTLDGKEIHLTPVEYKIVAYLSKNSGKVMTYVSCGLCTVKKVLRNLHISVHSDQICYYRGEVAYRKRKASFIILSKKGCTCMHPFLLLFSSVLI